MEPATIGRVSSVVGCPEPNAPPVQLAGGALKKQPEKIFPELPQENFRECQPLDSVSIFEGQLAQMGDVTGLDAPARWRPPPRPFRRSATARWSDASSAATAWRTCPSRAAGS